MSPGSLPAFPTSYRWCGKTGKSGAFPNNPETGKVGKTGTNFSQPHRCKEAISLVNKVITWRLNTRASWGMVVARIYVIDELSSVYVRACVMEYGFHDLIDQYARARARVMGYGG